jgi:hypothetical protein
VPQEPFSSAKVCPYLARFCPEGRSHTYDLCEAPGSCPLCPSQQELATLCHGDFEHCERFLAARNSEGKPDQRAA